MILKQVPAAAFLLWLSSLSPAFASSGDEGIAFLVLFIAAAFLGPYFFFKGFTALKRKRLMEDTPTSTIRAMAPGQVEVTGRAVDWNPLTAPFSRHRAVYYEVQVEEEHTRTVGSGKDRRTERYWVSIYTEDTTAKPFYLEDGTGKLLVLPEGSERVMLDSFHLQPGLFRDIPPYIVEYLKPRGVDCYGLFGFEKPLRFTERVFVVGETLYALGACRKSAAVRGAPEGAVEDYCLGRGTQGEVFILSDKSQKALTSSLGWKAFFGIFGGILVMAGVVYVLLTFGRLFWKPY